MRTTFILAVAAATLTQVSASEPAVQSRIPQQIVYPAYPNAANYAAARRAANEVAATATANYDYGYSPANPIGAPVAGGRAGLPIRLPYSRLGTHKDVNAAPNNVAPNGAAISAPPEELLGPFSGIVSGIESSVESSVLGKVTSLPASEASRLRSNIQSRESSILGIASLSSATASTTGPSNPRASAKVDEKSGESAESADGKDTNNTKGKNGNGEEAGKDEDKNSGAGALLWGNGGFLAVALFSLGVLFA